MLLTLGVILKFLTDFFTRTVFMIGLIDPLILITVLILIKYPKLKIVIITAIIQTVFSLIFFNSTDIWFLRPFIVLIAYFVILAINKRKKLSIRRKYLLSCFFTSMFTLTTVAIVLIGMICLTPNLLPIDQIQEQMLSISSTFYNIGLMSNEQLVLIKNSFKELLIISCVMFGTIFSLIPATIHLCLGFIVARIFKLEKTISQDIV